MESGHTRWTSRTAFIFAASAAAIGLGNIWRFPFLVGQNGGSAFVLLYLLFVILLGIPLITAEITFGRIGRNNPVKALEHVAIRSNRSREWRFLGGMSMLAGFLILTYYIVIAGWVLDYAMRAFAGHFQYVTEASSRLNFNNMTSNPWQMFITTSLIALSMGITITMGLKKGLERVVLFMFPLLVVILIVLLGYAMLHGDFSQGIHYLFTPNFHALTGKVVLMALGQAFFSLNIGMGITIMFSAYLPKQVPVASSAVIIAIADTSVALLAGMVIFPIVFAYHLSPSAGPGLIFESLPIAFGHIPYGDAIAALFFVMLLFAAFTSVVAMLEMAVAWLDDTFNLKRRKSAWIATFVCWALSLLTILSFTHADHVDLFDVTFYHAIDYLTANIMLPLGGFLSAIFAGWLLDKKLLASELGWNTHSIGFKAWRFLLRFIAPIAIVLILLGAIGAI